MRRVLMTAAMTLTIGTVGFAQAAKGGDKAQVDKGMKVYTEQKCSMCHSIAGKGAAKGPLDNVGAKYSADELRQWIVDPAAMAAKTKATRTPAMTSMAAKYKALPKDDVDALVAYLQTLKGAKK